MFNYTTVVKSDYINKDPREILQSPVSALLGVSLKTEKLLNDLQIKTVFDLATSRIFNRHYTD